MRGLLVLPVLIVVAAAGFAWWWAADPVIVEVEGTPALEDMDGSWILFDGRFGADGVDIPRRAATLEVVEGEFRAVVCNTMSGSFDVRFGLVDVTNDGWTEGGCDIAESELAYFAALAGARRVGWTEDRLVLWGRFGDLVFGRR